MVRLVRDTFVGMEKLNGKEKEIMLTHKGDEWGSVDIYISESPLTEKILVEQSHVQICNTSCSGISWTKHV